ncbi:MAG: hypothetical protein ABR597_03655 [Bacteroidales bacterium]
MIENEIIIVDQIPPADYDALLNECIRYAMISKPFTIRRVANQSLAQAILNIFKGKLAEELFRYFCEKNDIPADFDGCTTPFWQTDNRDFILNDLEWDIKNNYIYHPGDVLTSYNYFDLPALIPNRKPGDQWDSRDEIKNPGLCKGTGYVFTFLKGASIENRKRQNHFYNFSISAEQMSLIEKLEKRYRGKSHFEQPFTEQQFWDEMKKRGSLDFIELNYRPNLVITARADQSHWYLFKNTGPGDAHNNFQQYLKPYWYRKSGRGSINFMKRTFWTTLTNATCPVSALPSFLSLFPQLRDNINCGRIMNRYTNP